MRPEPPYRVFIGSDAHENRAVAVALHSMAQHTTAEIEVTYLNRQMLGNAYHRPTSRMPNGQLYDELSDAPMSTDHAIARFFLPYQCGYQGWALFTDGDVLFRDDVAKLFAMADDRYAVKVVQHPPLLVEGQKKQGHIQQVYPRKNWSSVVLFNCGHPANQVLTLDVLNTWPGRDLHAFNWIGEELIGVLPERWNYLVGVSKVMHDPSLAHFTLGTPDMREYDADAALAAEWSAVARLVNQKEAVRDSVTR